LEFPQKDYVRILDESHWPEKQKFEPTKKDLEKPVIQRKSPSQYVIRKLKLVGLVYNYTNSKTIQAIMEEVLDLWASILNSQYH